MNNDNWKNKLKYRAPEYINRLSPTAQKIINQSESNRSIQKFIECTNPQSNSDNNNLTPGYGSFLTVHTPWG